MKKLYSMILALSVLSSLSVNTAMAIDNSINGVVPTVNKAADNDSNNADLKKLASSLGADTDYFNFPNNGITTPEKDIMTAFQKNISQNEALLYKGENAPYHFENSDGSYGMAVLQVLSHNGVIPVSAIKEDAKNLCDVKFDKSVNDIIAYYDMSQEFLRQEFIMSYDFCNHTTEQQLKKLVDTAENAMENNKYFFVSFHANDSIHSVAGIGAADGNWLFNGKTYNKCILTLNSNFDNANDITGGFNENNCIYINTAVNTYYIPAYNADENNSSFRSVIDNDNLLNYKGLINPSAEIDVPTAENIASVQVGSSAKSREFNFSIINGDESETYKGTYNDFSLTEKMFYEGKSSLKKFYLDSADCYKFETANISEEDFKSSGEISVHTENSLQEIAAFGDFSAEIKKNYLSVTYKSYTETAGISMSLSSVDGLYKNPRFCKYNVWGKCAGTISVEETAEGIFVRHDAPLDAKITFLGTQTDENGTQIYLPQNENINQIGYEIYSVADNLWKYDEKTDDLVCYADPDNDGIFDTEVVTGDVNCDGKLDSSDASKILEIYADLSTNDILGPLVIMKRYADWDGDGSINASDASSVLKRYAELSTTK